jgi:hypothetical protein
MLVVLVLAGIFAMHGMQIACGQMGTHLGRHTLDMIVPAHLATEATADGGHGQTDSPAMQQGRAGAMPDATDRRPAVAASMVGPDDRVHAGLAETKELPIGAGAVMGLCVAVLGGSAVLLFGLLLRALRRASPPWPSVAFLSVVISSYVRSRRRRPRSSARTLSILCVSRT